MASLSANPSGLDLEDFVAAHLAARSQFVELGVTERDPVDVLELDVVWTNYTQPGAPRFPIEVKSGDWGLGDLFKFYGWAKYLRLDGGWYFVRQLPGRTPLDSLERLFGRLGLELWHVPNLDDVAARLRGTGLPEPAAEFLPELWRYSYWTQRRLLKSLGSGIDAGVCPGSARHAREYQKLINDAVFFEPDVRARVSALMDAHWNHPRLALSIAAEIGGAGLHLTNPPATGVFTDALYYGRHFPVQAGLLLEHRARLAILKAAVDYVIAREAGQLPSRTIRVFGLDVDLDSWTLHNAFRETVERIERSPVLRCYPVFWQTFLWSWGGFLLTDRLSDEYQQLSQETGVPVDEVDGALRLWDELFPIDGGWFATPSGDTRRQIKLLPAAMRGIGAYRRLLLAQTEEYTGLGLGDRTAPRLASDHNTVVRLLDGGDAELVR